MKRFLPGLCCALILSAFGPVTDASAHWWPWHHHSKSSASDASASASASAPTAKSKPPKAPKAPKAKKSKHHHEKTERRENNGSVVTTRGPRSIGWWHKQPGPAGAGAN